MKITKEMGRACLDGLERSAEIGDEVAVSAACIDGLEIMFGIDDWAMEQEHSLIALAMCAAIAGVKPEDVE